MQRDGADNGMVAMLVCLLLNSYRNCRWKRHAGLTTDLRRHFLGASAY